MKTLDDTNRFVQRNFDHCPFSPNLTIPVSSTGSHAPGGEVPESPQALLREIALVHPAPVKVLQQVLENRGAKVGLSALNLEIESLRSLKISPSPLPEKPNYILVLSDTKTVGPVDLSLHWSPEVECTLHSTSDSFKVIIRSDIVTPRREIKIPVDQVSEYSDAFPNRFVAELENALDRVIDIIGFKNDDPITKLPDIESTKNNARERVLRYESRATQVLRQIRKILAAWATIGLHRVPTGEVPESRLDSVLAPQSNFDQTHEIEEKVSPSRRERRNSIANHFSAYGLFTQDLRLLWKLIRSRSLAEARMFEMAELVSIPESITIPAAKAVKRLYGVLETIDENIVSPQTLVAACDIIATSIEVVGEIPFTKDHKTSRFTMTRSKLRDARILIEIVKHMDEKKFDEYSDICEVMSNDTKSSILTDKEEKDKSCSSIVKQSQRAAELLEVCDYRMSDEYGPDDLIRELRKADDKGEIPE